MSVGIELMAMIKVPYHLQVDDPYGMRPLVRALTRSDNFWEILATKPLQTRKKIITYLEANKNDYIFAFDYERFKEEALRSTK